MPCLEAPNRLIEAILLVDCLPFVVCGSVVMSVTMTSCWPDDAQTFVELSECHSWNPNCLDGSVEDIFHIQVQTPDWGHQTHRNFCDVEGFILFPSPMSETTTPMTTVYPPKDALNLEKYITPRFLGVQPKVNVFISNFWHQKSQFFKNLVVFVIFSKVQNFEFKINTFDQQF